MRIQNLAADVSMIEFVVADGSIVRYTRAETPALLEGSRVHLGSLGVVSKLSLDVVPYYEVSTKSCTNAMRASSNRLLNLT